MFENLFEKMGGLNPSGANISERVLFSEVAGPCAGARPRAEAREAGGPAYGDRRRGLQFLDKLQVLRT